jgi:hypothetical protein
MISSLRSELIIRDGYCVVSTIAVAGTAVLTACSPPRSSVLTAALTALTALTAARVGELGAGTVLVVALLGRALPP